MSRPHQWTAIVPVKDFRSAKSRLHGADAPTDRLARAFLEDMLEALRSVDGIVDILVATHDPVVEAVVANAGAATVDDRGHPGINAAAARAAAVRRPGTGIAVLVSDLPCLTGPCVELALGLAALHPVSFLPDLDGTGTSMWMSPHGEGLPTHFGADSRRAHADAGAVDLVDAHPDAAARLRPARLDVDTEVALTAAITEGVGPRTEKVLTE